MQFSLAQIQAATGAEFENSAAADARVTGWSIDSRTVQPGDLFFALRGENSDGHNFVVDVLAKGAAAAIVSQPVAANGNILHVCDTLRALQQLALWARRKWGNKIIAITGSAGKTSTKDIVAALLAVRFRVGKTVGNFNNHIGLPISLLRIPGDAELAVLEMGMNHAGEIRDLCRIAEPEIGVVTNVGYAHIENFDSIEGIAAAKRELIDSLPPGGAAVLNADDPRVAKFDHPHRLLYSTANIGLQMTPAGAQFTVDGIRFQTCLAGQHAVSNILAGITVATLFGIETKDLVEPVAALTPGKMRGERHLWKGAHILNDAYNSNPEAARQMLDVLRNEPGSRRIAVLGEMRELGRMSEQLHRDLGAYAANSKLDLLVGVHGAARATVEEAISRGLPKDSAVFFEDPEAAGEYLKHFVQSGDTILFKGSRGTKVERAIAAMEANS